MSLVCNINWDTLHMQENLTFIILNFKKVFVSEKSLYLGVPPVSNIYVNPQLWLFSKHVFSKLNKQILKECINQYIMHVWQLIIRKYLQMYFSSFTRHLKFFLNYWKNNKTMFFFNFSNFKFVSKQRNNLVITSLVVSIVL